MTVLVTGAAGFIGAHVMAVLLMQGRRVVGLDNFNDYYDVALKRDRVAALIRPHGGAVDLVDCADMESLRSFFHLHAVTQVVHLAAQAGVRYSLENPGAYVHSNLVGFANILECCRHSKVDHLVYASSSSVYGSNEQLPWDEDDNVTHPVSLYAATKASNELLAHSYSHLYRLPATALRFFTVYGPWGRPDMAPMLFAKAISVGGPIRVFNNGHMERDFTYIDDVVQAVCRVLDRTAEPDRAFDRRRPSPATSHAPHRVFNVGNHSPVALTRFIEILERVLKKTAVRQFESMQPGDVVSTFASTDRIKQWVGFAPSTPLEQGLEAFGNWYRDYFAGRSDPVV